MGFELASKRGVVAHYGPRVVNNAMGGRSEQEYKKSAKWIADFNNLPTYGSSNIQQIIPAGSTIIACRFRILEKFAGGSANTTVGLVKKDGTGGDDDGLMTAAGDGASATLKGKDVGDVLVSSAALINKPIGADPLELVVAFSAGGTTAGRMEIVIDYLTPVV